MRVFMLGWEFPPHISGGLGTACYGLTKGLDEIGVEVCFVLPTAVPAEASSHVKLRSPTSLAQAVKQQRAEQLAGFEHVSMHQVAAYLSPYASPESVEMSPESLEDLASQIESIDRTEAGNTTVPTATQEGSAPQGSFVAGPGAHYHGNLMEEVQRYARLAVALSRSESFDVIHAHDWMTYPAGVAVKRATGKPLVVHVHSTEFDRSGDNVNQQVYDVERAGMHAADKVVCVSHLTRATVVNHYGIAEDKTEVIYNAVALHNGDKWDMSPIRHDEKIVLFLGRVTMQKGPEYFLQAARKVIDHYDKVRFIMAGSGDMIQRCIRMSAEMGLSRHVTFTGFLRGPDVDRVFRMADLYVMPSVSEPFGIAPLEALSHDVPVIISKQSGVSEVLTHALKVDFWDIDEMANKILAVLRHDPLGTTLRQHGKIELRKFSWTDSAARLRDLYQTLTGPC